MRHEDREFRNQTLVLDGNSYVRCTIMNCDLSYSGTTAISLVDCTMGANEFVYAGHAAITVRVLQEIARTGAGGLDHVMRLMIGSAPVDWHKIAALGELPAKDENRVTREKPRTEIQQMNVTIRVKGSATVSGKNLRTPNEMQFSRYRLLAPRPMD